MANKKILMVNDHHKKTGIGKYFFNLYQSLQQLSPQEFEFSRLDQNIKSSKQEAPPHNCQYRPFGLRGKTFGKTYDMLSWYYFPRRIPAGYDLYHISSQMMGKSVAHVSPAVITCHDIMPFQFFGNHNRFSEHYRKKQILAMQRASFIIFISEFTKSDFMKRFDYDEKRTDVIHHGIDSVFHPRNPEVCRRELGLPCNRPIVLHVGTEAPRKNPRTLLEAIKKVRQALPNILLIRIGGKRPETRSWVSELSLTENVAYYGNLEENQLAKYYNAADLFFFPSLYEGYGMPVLEAMKSGCPVVAADATSIPEVTGNAAILHPPRDIEGFALTILRLLNDSTARSDLSARGMKRATDFTWERAAERTLNVYKKLI